MDLVLLTRISCIPRIPFGEYTSKSNKLNKNLSKLAKHKSFSTCPGSCSQQGATVPSGSKICDHLDLVKFIIAYVHCQGPSHGRWLK